MSAAAIDEARLEEFMGRTVTDMSAMMSAPLMYMGDRLGFYRAMAHAGPMTSAELAKRTSCDERMVREWLANQTAGGYVTHDPERDTYELPDEHALALADEDSPFYVMGGFDVMASVWGDEAKLERSFREGHGFGWDEHDHRLFDGTDRFFRPGYQAFLTTEWIPALEGVEQKLKDGARVADIGCGYGSSTVIMAQAYPKSRFWGIDYHAESIARAREKAERAGVADRITFETEMAQDFVEDGFDLICNFDCLHDMGDPLGAARHAAETLKPDGTYMIVEPIAGDSLEDNMTPVGRMYYAASTMICTPASEAQPVGAALGAQAGQKRLEQVLHEAGFSRVRRAAETPFNMILEARL
jgi:2-polyprenyl-3-methyl-5-hydroxy-6-metoxy-1,4-benzoquinol methylase